MKNEALAAFFIIVITAVFVIAVLSFLPPESLPERALLNADEIPGDWKLDPNYGDETHKRFYVGEIPDAPPAYIRLGLTQYGNSTLAHQEFLSRKSYHSYFISQEPALGDECYLMSANSSSAEYREILCRVGDITVHAVVMSTQGHYLTDEWIFDLIQLQIEKIQRSR